MRAVVFVVVAGCSFHPTDGLDGRGTDGRPRDTGDPTDGQLFFDAPAAASDGCTSFSTQFDTCTVAPTQPISGGSSKIYDTDNHTLSDYPGGANPQVLGPDLQTNVIGADGPINVWLATNFALSGGKTLRVVGSRPFGIVATGAIVVDGTIDASSDSMYRGAGAIDPPSCGAATPPKVAPHIGGAGGGGGGAFRGSGGKGGDGDNNETGQAGGIGGTAVAKPAGPRGGCGGGSGGDTPPAGGTGIGGAGGLGGGAVYLVSATSIQLKASGVVTAGGAGGGLGGRTDGGGGGGGSGGMILLEAPTIALMGTLAANGGSGGGGAGGNSAGGPGATGPGSAMQAVGGTAPSNATVGAKGSGGAVIDGPANNLPALAAAGGGGGGGGGFIAIKGLASVAGGAVVSPPLVAWP